MGFCGGDNDEDDKVWQAAWDECPRPELNDHYLVRGPHSHGAHVTRPPDAERERVDVLVELGAVQISRKHRRVYVPPKEGCVAWLRENDPKGYDSLVEDCLKRFEAEARNSCRSRAHFPPGGSPYKSLVSELSEAEYNYFRQLTTGRVPWSPTGKAHCTGCGSLGHMHRRGCPALHLAPVALPPATDSPLEELPEESR